MNSRYVTTGTAARELGISSATLTRWVAAGIVTPAEVTAGGHFRWDLAALRAHVRRLRVPADARRVLAEDIAACIHDANRRYQITLGDPNVSPLWDEAPARQIEGAVESVLALLDDPERTAEQNHEGWRTRLVADGWRHGEAKDEQAKTHPLLVPFAALSAEERRKDFMFVAIVRALTAD